MPVDIDSIQIFKQRGIKAVRKSAAQQVPQRRGRVSEQEAAIEQVVFSRRAKEQVEPKALFTAEDEANSLKFSKKTKEETLQEKRQTRRSRLAQRSTG